MKKWISLLVLALCALGCSGVTTVDGGDMSEPAEPVAGIQQAEKTANCKPVADGWEGCKPGTTCASPPSITGLRSGGGLGGTNKELWVYYNGAWRNAISFGGSTLIGDIGGNIGGPGKPAIGQLTMTNQTYWDGPGARITAQCFNPTTYANECASQEVVIHKMQFATPKTCTFGTFTVGITRVVGNGYLTGEGDFEFRGWNNIPAYVSCDLKLVNSCTP